MGAADIWRERAIRDELASERRAAMRRERARLAAREETSKSEKREDADRLLKIREGDVAKGLPISPKIGRLKFDDAAADLLTDYKVNGRRAVEHVKRRIKKGLTPYFGGWRMANITTADIRKYIDHRQEAGAANATINRELAALKWAFTLAIQAGKLLQRPHIPMLQERNARHGFFERPQFASVRDRLPEALQGIATFAYINGWRTKSEILPLTWAQVDRAAGIVRLEPDTTKNREGRQFPYSDLPELKAVLDAQWTAHTALKKAGTICPYVFQRAGKRVRNFRRAWLSATEAAGCPGRIPHDFRRTAVRNLVRAGVPEKTAMTITGHKTRSVFDRYDIVNEQDQREAVRKLAATVREMSVDRKKKLNQPAKADRVDVRACNKTSKN
jgi:site-specific recombinase XerD